ncbi:MAG TPA: PadR family transcriptional regulator [Acidimicrobiia bacterium]
MVASRADGDRPGADRSSQLLKGVLEMCLLAVIEKEPSYGYEMVRKLADRGLDLVSEGTIYPVLSRLQKGGLVEGYLVESPEGPARKYYRIAPDGRATLEKWSKDWQRLVAGVEKVLGEGAGGG